MAVACGVAGIISGSITMTGLASVRQLGIISVANGKLIITLLLTMLCYIVLRPFGCTCHCQLLYHGSNLCSDPGTYGSTYTAAHFFVFYFGIVCRYHAGGAENTSQVQP